MYHGFQLLLSGTKYRTFNLFVNHLLLLSDITHSFDSLRRKHPQTCSSRPQSLPPHSAPTTGTNPHVSRGVLRRPGGDCEPCWQLPNMAFVSEICCCVGRRTAVGRHCCCSRHVCTRPKASCSLNILPSPASSSVRLLHPFSWSLLGGGVNGRHAYVRKSRHALSRNP